METQAEFHIGERIVYPLHGMGRVDEVCLRIVDGEPEFYYRLVLERKAKGEALVPLSSAQALGLRPVLRASQVAEALQQVQQSATQPVTPGQRPQHYAWCKSRLRQGDVLGLAEVWRFLHDLEQVERITHVKMQHLRDYVAKQLPAELVVALNCTDAEAEHLLALALTSEGPVVHPSPEAGSSP